mgnify:CR=1 FL=1
MKLTALVIDDSKIMRMIIMKLLNESGLAKFKFIEARNGLEALHLFNPEKIDICFVDWNMPKMDGLEFVIKARQMAPMKKIPMIFITSEKCIGKMDCAGEQGADSYITKPFNVDILKFKLQPIIERLT